MSDVVNTQMGDYLGKYIHNRSREQQGGLIQIGYRARITTTKIHLKLVL